MPVSILIIIKAQAAWETVEQDCVTAQQY